jgi:hypothetical protein
LIDDRAKLESNRGEGIRLSTIHESVVVIDTGIAENPKTPTNRIKNPGIYVLNSWRYSACVATDYEKTIKFP